MEGVKRVITVSKDRTCSAANVACVMRGDLSANPVTQLPELVPVYMVLVELSVTGWFKH